MKKYILICCLVWGVIKMSVHSQFYDPSLDMMQYYQTLQNISEKYIKSLAEIQENQQRQNDENARATITYMYDGSGFYAFVTYVAGSPIKMNLVSPSGSQSTLLSGTDYFYASGAYMVMRNLQPGSTLRIYCSGTGKLLSYKSIPSRDSSEYEDFCVEALDNCNKVASIVNGTMNLNGFNSSANYPSSGTYTAEKKRCSLCGGKGWISGCSTPSYGSGSYYCSECQRTVPGSHSHDRCPPCGGTGYQ